MEQQSEKRDVYSLITDRIIKQLELGTIPWRKSWTDAGMPQNLVTKKPYRGINVWLLASLGYERNLFLTFRQANELKGYIKKGEKSHIVVYTKKKADVPQDAKMQSTAAESEERKTKQGTILHYYQVFNIAQCVGIQNDKIPELVRNISPIETCEAIVQDMPNCPPIIEQTEQGCYDYSHDVVNIAEMETFPNSLAYYSAVFYELVHSTGHAKRLNWKELMRAKWSGPESFLIGELIAEIAACYLNSFAGIPVKDCTYNVAYPQRWIKHLKRNNQFIFSMSAMAQKAVDYILNNQASNVQTTTN